MTYLSNHGGKSGPLESRSQAAALSVWDMHDPRSVIRLVPERFQKIMLRIPEDMRGMPEGTVRAKFPPTATDTQLRLSFWLEYDRVQSEYLDAMEMKNVTRGIMGHSYFFERYLEFPHQAIWLVTPPISYEVAITEAREFGVNRLREVLSIPIQDKKGKYDIRAANLLMKVVSYLDNRVHGTPTQRIAMDQRSVKVDMKASAADMAGLIEGGNMSALDQRLKYLEKKERMIEQGAHPKNSTADIEVEATAVAAAPDPDSFEAPSFEDVNV